MLKKLRMASVLVFARRRPLNPKTLKPQTLKPWKKLNPKAENAAYTPYTQYFHVFSAISLLMFDDRESSMLQSGQM